jgi:hypothetical protein
MSETRTIVFCCIAAVALGIGACARETVVLENRFTKGEELRYLLTTRGEGTMSIVGLPGQKSGAESALNLQEELAYAMRVRDVDAGGNADIECSFQRFKSMTQSGDLKIQTEADESGARLIQGETVIEDAPAISGLRALFKNPTLIKMDKRRNVLAVTPPSDVDSLLPHVNVCSLLKQNQVVLPANPVAVGSSWTEKIDIVLGGGMEERLPGMKDLKLDATYTLTGMVDREGRKCAEIAVRGEIEVQDMELSPPEKAKVPMSVMLDRLKQRLEGKIYFDRQLGRVLSFHLVTTQDAVVTMEVARAGVVPLTNSTQVKMEADLKLLE